MAKKVSETGTLRRNESRTLIHLSLLHNSSIRIKAKALKLCHFDDRSDECNGRTRTADNTDTFASTPRDSINTLIKCSGMRAWIRIARIVVATTPLTYNNMNDCRQRGRQSFLAVRCNNSARVELIRLRFVPFRIPQSQYRINGHDHPPIQIFFSLIVS